jgi:hypothetical protein
MGRFLNETLIITPIAEKTGTQTQKKKIEHDGELTLAKRRP